MATTRFITRIFCTNSKKVINNKNAVGGANLVEKVAVARDGKTIVGWHPDTVILYEMTEAIKTSEVKNSSLLKDNVLDTAMRAFKDQHPEVARQELMRLTHTTKHRWFPRPRDKKAKKDNPMDRPYL